MTAVSEPQAWVPGASFSLDGSGGAVLSHLGAARPATRWRGCSRSNRTGGEERMRRAGTLLALTLGAALLAESTAAARPAHPPFGVFATINGKRYKAPATGQPDDRCVNGTYVASGGIVFGAIECHGRGRLAIDRSTRGSHTPNEPPEQARALTLLDDAGSETRPRRRAALHARRQRRVAPPRPRC